MLGLGLFFNFFLLSIDIESWIIDIIVLGKVEWNAGIVSNDPDTIK